MRKAGSTSDDLALDPALVEGLRRRLIGWYEAHRRDLPWRRTRDPYHIWVSEIMLQQTQVETVKPYYHRFLEAFPDVEALASAEEEAVLSRWAGLGYYSRARNLHRGAQAVVREHGGVVPTTVERLRSIPGVGPYTAGAIASIAFGVAAPILDGNVARVLSRVFHLTADPRSTAGRAALWQLAEALVPEGQASSFNQGLMELGATVCVPGKPRCASCPLEPLCEARARGDQASLPTRSPRAARPQAITLAAILVERGRVLVARRPSRGLLGGLWDFPLVALEGPPPSGRRGDALLAEALGWRTGLIPGPATWLEPVDHLFTHLSLRVYPVRCEVAGGELAPQPPAQPGGPIVAYAHWRWVALSEVVALPMGAVMARLAEGLSGEPSQLRLL